MYGESSKLAPVSATSDDATTAHSKTVLTNFIIYPFYVNSPKRRYFVVKLKNVKDAAIFFDIFSALKKGHKS